MEIVGVGSSGGDCGVELIVGLKLSVLLLRFGSLSSAVGEVGNGWSRAWTAASSNCAGSLAKAKGGVAAAVAGDAGGLLARSSRSTSDGLALSLGRRPSCIKLCMSVYLPSLLACKALEVRRRACTQYRARYYLSFSPCMYVCRYVRSCVCLVRNGLSSGQMGSINLHALVRLTARRLVNAVCDTVAYRHLVAVAPRLRP